MATPSPDAQIRDVNLHPEDYSLGVRVDGQPVIRRGLMGHTGVEARHFSPEAQKAGEVVLKNLGETPNDPYLKACAQLILSKEHAGEVSPELISRLQAILTPAGAGRAPVAEPPGTGDRERKTKMEEGGAARRGTDIERGPIGAVVRRGAAAGPSDEPVLGHAAAKGRDFDIGGLAEAAIAPIPVFHLSKLEIETTSPLQQELLKGCIDARDAVVLPFELDALKSNPQYPKLQNYNLELMRVKAMANYIEDKRNEIIQRGESPDKKEAMALLNQYRDVLNNAYAEINSERIAFVKACFPENPVYALAIPIKLKAGAHYYTAGAEYHMKKIVFNGFVFTGAATCCASPESWEKVEKSFTTTQEGRGFAGGEMGNKGYYFSLDGAPYANETAYPFILETELMEDINGVSIPQVVSDLTIRTGHNLAARKNRFTPEEVEKGYAALQKDFGFLQNQGIQKACDTEVVFINPQHKLRLASWQLLPMPNRYSMDDIAAGLSIEDAVPPPIHASWRR